MVVPHVILTEEKFKFVWKQKERVNKMNTLVIMKEKQAVTTSLQIAEAFEKQHKHVIESIEKLLEEDGSNFRPMFMNGNEP